MAKEERDKACNLDLPNGYHGLPYRQQFERAPKSLHPPKRPGRPELVPEAMSILMGK